MTLEVKSQFVCADAHLHIHNTQFLSLLFTEITDFFIIILVAFVVMHCYESSDVFKRVWGSLISCKCNVECTACTG